MVLVNKSTKIPQKICFESYNTSSTQNEKGQQYLDFFEAASARRNGAPWAQEGQTKEDFINAHVAYAFRASKQTGGTVALIAGATQFQNTIYHVPNKTN